MTDIILEMLIFIVLGMHDVPVVCPHKANCSIKCLVDNKCQNLKMGIEN